ncbi:MAG TPA: GDP-mannose 4,6-dehydratase [Candidatus Binatia bacterium]|nr:GDP-mannose 4,6-dehydratase [Candidatus Binatia bacterium]
MRVLVTGGNGFVGRYLVSALRDRGDDVVSAGHAPEGEHRHLDLTDASNVRDLIDDVRPERIFHLAAQTFVPDAIASPLETFDVNVMGTARLLDAVRGMGQRTAAAPRIVFASSGQAEHPADPYGASKAAAEALVHGFAKTYAMDVVTYRGFNQIGPAQDARFVVASFARQLAEIADGANPVMLVGNLEAKRDFLDVRDAVAAIVMLADRGESGETYNVCRGEGVAISEVLRKLIMIAGVPVEIREDPQRMRPSDNPVVVGDPAKLRERTGWTPQYSLEQTLRDVYGDARKRVTATR